MSVSSNSGKTYKSFTEKNKSHKASQKAFAIKNKPKKKN